MTHICVSKLTIIGSDNGLSPHRRQAIIWTNAGILLIGPLRTKFSEILIKILRVLFKKMHLKGSSAKWRPFCLGLNVLTHCGQLMPRLQYVLSTVHVMACCIFSTKSLPEPMLTYFILSPLEINFNEIWIKIQSFFTSQLKVSAKYWPFWSGIHVFKSLRPSDAYMCQ